MPHLVCSSASHKSLWCSERVHRQGNSRWKPVVPIRLDGSDVHGDGHGTVQLVPLALALVGSLSLGYLCERQMASLCSDQRYPCHRGKRSVVAMVTRDSQIVEPGPYLSAGDCENDKPIREAAVCTLLHGLFTSLSSIHQSRQGIGCP